MKTMHILSNSHLDREHRHEFQETRLMMVEMLDDVIRIMETDDSYRYFTLDGQAIVLDDYLEMRPPHRVVRPHGPQVFQKMIASVQYRNGRAGLKGAAAGAAGQK